MDAWVQMVLDVSKYGGIVLAAFFGIVGIVATYREQTRTITRWGWTSIILTSVAAMVGLAGVTAEIVNKQQEAAEQANKTLAMLHEIRRSQQPLRTILVDVEAQAPDNDHLDKLVAADMAQYRFRLDQDYQTEQHKQLLDDIQQRQERWRRLQDVIHGVPAAPQAANGSLWLDVFAGGANSPMSAFRLPVSWRYSFIDPQSPLFPDVNKEFWSYELLSNLNTTFWFFKNDNPAIGSDSVNLALNDLQFSCYLSNNDTKNRPALAYDVEKSKSFALSGKNIVASSESWASNGKIISIEDLLGTRMIVRSTTNGSPVGPLGIVPVVFKPKLIHFRIVDRDVYLSDQDFKPATADDGTSIFTYLFPQSEEEFAKLRRQKQASGN